MSEPIYTLRNVSKSFMGPAERIDVLSNVNLAVSEGESLAVLGASGSGKTTLLHILGSLDNASSGEVLFQGRELSGLSGRKKARLRNRDVGFVFQFHHLLPEFTCRENVAMPALIRGTPKDEAMDMAARALEQVGLELRAEHRVTTLSGGERQRAAIARAILSGPKVLLADEPTGNLDEATGKRVGGLLARLNRDLNMTLVIVTHNLELAMLMGRRLELKSGELSEHA